MSYRVLHAQFLYFEEVGIKEHPMTGEEVPDLASRFAFNGQVVDIPREEDVEKGLKFGAIEEVSDDASTEAEEAEEESENNEVINMDSHDDLVEWIGDDQPPAREVVAAAENNPVYAKNLMAAEEEASGSQPRKSVMDPLRKIAAKG